LRFIERDEPIPATIGNIHFYDEFLAILNLPYPKKSAIVEATSLIIEHQNI
jgi:hypothetical protein